MSIVSLKNVSYKYPLQKQYALENINLNLEEGKFYGLIGENSGGKTTLCNLIRGLIPHFYNGDLEGEAVIYGTEVRDWDTAEISAKIGYVFQNPFTQISGIKETVFEEIAMGLENLGVPKDEMIERVCNVCKLLKIEHLIENNPNELSGGQRQRVAFASIIAMDTDLLVIDEPTSQLDPEGTEDVFEIIKTLKNSGKTIILVEHKIDLIAEYCDEVIVMNEGKIVFNGPTQEVLSNKELLEQNAVIPQVALLGHLMNDLGKPLEQIPITIDQAVALIKQREGK